MNEEQSKVILPGSWKWMRLCEIAEVNPPIPNRDTIDGNTEVQFLPMKLVEELSGEIHLNEIRRYEEVKKGYTPFIEGDLIFAKVTPCMENGKIALVLNLKNKIGFGSSEFHVVRCKGDLSSKYLFYYLVQQKFRNEAENAMTGAVGLRRVPKLFLENYKLPIPILKTQQKIVDRLEELFSELDKSIESLRHAQQQLKTYRQSVLKWAFEGKLTEEWRKENGIAVRMQSGLLGAYVVSSGIEPKRIAAEPLTDYQISENRDELPKGWKRVKLSDVAKKKSVKALPKDYPNAKFIGMDCIEPHTLRPTFLYDFSEFKSAGNHFKLNQVLYGRMRPYLNKVYRAEFDGACSGEFIILDCVNNYNPDLLKYILHSKEFVSFANSITTGDRPRISYDEIAEYSVPLCSPEEQHQIVSEIEFRLSVANEMEESIAQGLQQAEVLRQSILKKAFEGKLVDAKKPTVYKPKSEYFYQANLLGLVIRASKKKNIAHGEMTIAKYAYLLDKAFDVPTFYSYERWHLGPYPPEIKKAINNKKFFKKQNGSIEVVDEKVLFKHNSHYQKEIEAAVDSLAAIFLKYSAKERAHKTELLATVCKVVEDIQTLDLQAVRVSMKEWKIELEGSSYKSKAEKFTEVDTEKCLGFIIDKGWDRKLVTK